MINESSILSYSDTNRPIRPRSGHPYYGTPSFRLYCFVGTALYGLVPTDAESAYHAGELRLSFSILNIQPTMASLAQSIRDNVVYASGYFQGRSYQLPRSFAELYAVLVSKVTSLISLPLPFLSFLALPFFSGSSTTISLVFFYLTWSTLVLSHSQLSVEIYGTLAVRLFCFVLPALGFLAFDCAIPNLSKGIKNRGTSQLPLVYGRNKLLELTGVALLNVFIAVALQAALEFLCTGVLHTKSILQVTSTVRQTDWHKPSLSWRHVLTLFRFHFHGPS